MARACGSKPWEMDDVPDEWRYRVMEAMKREAQAREGPKPLSLSELPM